MKMSYFFKQTHISRKRIVLIFSDLLRQITLCLSSKDGSATLRNSDTGAKFRIFLNMNWTIASPEGCDLTGKENRPGAKF